jgi:hypothetical protein
VRVKVIKLWKKFFTAKLLFCRKQSMSRKNPFGTDVIARLPKQYEKQNKNNFLKKYLKM